MKSVAEKLAAATWLDTLLGRRSRRFALGMKMPSGPLAFTSRHAPRRLDEDEEAALAFAATGITGHALADLCYTPGQGGNIMNAFVGRACASGDGIQAVAMFVSNDEATWLLKRPREFTPVELADMIRLAKEKSLTEAYHRTRLAVKASRSSVSSEPLFNLNCNRWSAAAPGTSCFLPVNDLTLMYINGLLEIFNETTGAFVLDERSSFRPAGLAAFARSKGGHLYDDPREGRVATIELVERLVTEFVTIEQGMILQNLALMTQALGLGGFPNFANHEFAWFQALGFRMAQMPVSQYLGAGKVVSWALKASGKDASVPYPLGLEQNGSVLLKAYCPPYFNSMTEAVRAVAAGKTEAAKQAGEAGVWKPGLGIADKIPGVSNAALEATVAYCEYVWARYGRFPAYLAPFRTVVGYQACHLDVEFYDRFYQPEALTEAQREDFREQASRERL